MSRILRHFSLFIFLSLLLHFGVFLYFTAMEQKPSAPKPTTVPFFVDLRESEQKPRELDIPLDPQPTPRLQPGKRFAASDQVVTREQAPKGSDWRDRTPLPATQPPPVSSAAEQKEVKSTRTPYVSEKGHLPTLSREALLMASKSAAQNIADLDPDINQKMRRDVEEGKAVWLDTEKDILGSFYKRFRDAVMLTWDYPKEAINRGESGVCLYRIEINRAGVLIREPELLKSSGHTSLDTEARRAVVRAAPSFGFLPDAYRYETLTVFAYFDYSLGTKTIYGESFYR